jgi:hypothetical protein
MKAEDSSWDSGLAANKIVRLSAFDTFREFELLFKSGFSSRNTQSDKRTIREMLVCKKKFLNSCQPSIHFADLNCFLRVGFLRETLSLTSEQFAKC